MNLANRERASQDRIGTGPRHGRRCPGRGWGPPPGGFPLDPQEPPGPAGTWLAGKTQGSSGSLCILVTL